VSVTAILAGRAATPSGVIENAVVLVEGERIAAVDRADRLPIPESANVLRCDVLLPGFIDLHVHGANGHSFGESADAARKVARSMARAGVTTCYAGLGAGPTLEAIAETVAHAAEVALSDTGGARIAGVFMEGPFISRERKGAWNADHLRAPKVSELRELVAASQGRIRRVNVAPELPGALDFIRAAREAGLAVSIGHSDATYSEALAGVDAGASITNHTYNAMSPLDHRAPGLAGATLTCDALLAELILDHVHVHPAAAALLLRSRGAGGVCLITDGSMMSGMPDGVYESPARTVVVKDGSARLPNGTLAGSVATFDQGLRNAAKLPGIELNGLGLLAATNAATAMGLSSETGSIAPGLFADLALLTAGLEVEATVSRGTLVYERAKVAE
jgi:N-acetylglucosamine-6-phosphate deacetylase